MSWPTPWLSAPLYTAQLGELKASGPGALQAYLRNLRVALFGKAAQVFVEV